MIDSTKQDLEETTNVRVSHRDVQREAAAAARETTLRENGLEPISAKVIVAFVVIAVIAGGVMFKDTLFNYGDHPTGYVRGADPNGGAGPPTTGEAFDVYFKHGQAKFTSCATCHGGDGAGNASAPPLVGSEWAQDLNTHLVSIAVNGVKGPIEVKGVTWNAEMPAIAASWDDFDLAALATYVSNLGKDTKNITSIEQIQDFRKRQEQWEAEGGGQVTAQALTGKDYFQGTLEGEAIGSSILVNKKSGLPE